MTAKKASAKKATKKKQLKQVDPAVTKALARRYGIKTAVRGARYNTPEEVLNNPEAWDGDVTDLLEDDLKEDDQVENGS